MHVRGLLVIAVGGLCGVSAAVANPAWTEANVKVVAAPKVDARPLGEIPKGSKIDIDDCADGWCSLMWGGHKAFVLQGHLSKGADSPLPKPQFPK
jgi:SH3-like domain-containing protein